MWFARSWIYANAIEEKRKSNAIKLNIIHNQLGNPTHLPPTTPPPHCLSYEWGQSKRKPGKSNQQTDNLKNSMATSLHSHRLSQAGRDREGGREGKRDREGSTGFSSSDNSLHLPQLLEALGASRATWAASKLIFDCELLASKFGSISNRCSLPTPSAIRLCNQSSAWLRSNGRGQLSVCVCVGGSIFGLTAHSHSFCHTQNWKSNSENTLEKPLTCAVFTCRETTFLMQRKNNNKAEN